MPRPAPTPKRLLALLERFAGQRVAVLGDLMLDQFVRGKVHRISPEAPVPVVQVTEESHVPGGAGNVASNLAALGAAVSVLGALGRDHAGQLLLADLEARGADVSGVLWEEGWVSTQKVRVVAEHQQVVRFDRERDQQLSPHSRRRLLGALDYALRGCTALVLSDYGKGILTPDVLRAAILAARRRGVPVVVDPKVEHFRRYRGVDCVTPNLAEASGGMRRGPPRGEDGLEALGLDILRALKARSVLITRGEKGMSLFEERGVVRHIPTQAREVYDVSGAGDTVTGLMALGLAAGAKPYEAALLANAGAGVVVAKLGTATVSPAELRAALKGAR